MSCLGVFFALTSSERERLLSVVALGQEAIRFLQNEVEAKWDAEWLCDIDKSWDAMHRCLTDGTLGNDDSTPAHWCVLNGRQLCTTGMHIVSFVDIEEVRQVSQDLEGLDEQEFSRRYDRMAHDYEGDRSVEDFEITWENFQAVRDFYQRAATAGRSVVFTVSQ